MARCINKNCRKIFDKNGANQVVCSIKCAITLEQEKKEKHMESVKKAETKEMKIKSFNWAKETVIKIQQIARLIDYKNPCLARGYENCQFHGGHVFSRGSSGNMKYNLHNIFAQSAQSNHWQNDDHLLRQGIKNTFGNIYYEFIESLQASPVPKKTNEEWHMTYQKALNIINRLKKENDKLAEKRDPKERVRLRNLINDELGIYEEKYCKFELK